MAIDIRATVTCSLGTLISGSISDDYIQGSGLVKIKGSVEISGTITPAIGTVVTFSYITSGTFADLLSWYDETIVAVPAATSYFPITAPTATAEVIITGGVKATRYSVTLTVLQIL